MEARKNQEKKRKKIPLMFGVFFFRRFGGGLHEIITHFGPPDLKFFFPWEKMGFFFFPKLGEKSWVGRGKIKKLQVLFSGGGKK